MDGTRQHMDGMRMGHMDGMQMEQEQEQGPGADEAIIELLRELVSQGRSRRAEGVMTPDAPVETEQPPADDEMAELEQMLAASPEGTQSDEMPPEEMPLDGMPPKKKPKDDEEQG